MLLSPRALVPLPEEHRTQQCRNGLNLATNI